MEHLDYDTLNTLRHVMEDDFQLLIDTFIQDSQDRIVTLHKVIEASDPDAIRRAAHSFKGSSSNIGALCLTQLCAELEQKALANNLTDLPQQLDAIEREFTEVKALLLSLD